MSDTIRSESNRLSVPSYCSSTATLGDGMNQSTTIVPVATSKKFSLPVQEGQRTARLGLMVSCILLMALFNLLLDCRKIHLISGSIYRVPQKLYTANTMLPQPLGGKSLRDVNKANLQDKNAANRSDYAYAFLLAGCDPDQPSYRGYLFSILVSIHNLQTSGSTADFVLLLRLSSNTPHDELPANELDWLQALNCQIVYLPKPSTAEDFTQAQMLKFHILELVQYRRVLYLDADVMPVCNLDYIFHLSDGTNPLLQGNLVVAWTKEPANGGFFMLTPGHFQHLQDIVEEQRLHGATLPYPHFDIVQGWGHVLDASDPWSSYNYRNVGRKWNFYAAHADQGLLYHWVKYVQQSVTIVANGQKAENWSSRNGTLYKQRELIRPFANYSCIPKEESRGFAHHPAYGGNLLEQHPYSDFVHHYNFFKPWEQTLAEEAILSRDQANSSRQYWFHSLRELNGQLGMGIDFDRWSDYSESFRTSSPYKDNRVPSLEELMKQKENNETNRAASIKS